MVRPIALLLTLLTGFSGLVYEVTWQKYFATLLGSHSEATATVLGIFLGGLSVGYSLFGAVTRRLVARGVREGRPPQLLFSYGLVEASIGFYALVFPLVFRLAMSLSTRISLGGGALGFAVDVALSALLIGPPTVLMGGTIPLLTQALSRSLQDATRFHALVYAFNTIGAFAGALAAGFVLVPALGFDAVMRWMGAVNLIAGGTFLLLGRRAPLMAARPAARAEDPPATVRGFAYFAAAALLAGFAMMTIQTVLIRLGVLAFGASQFTFSMVVAVFVLCIALGSFAVSALPRIPTGTVVFAQWALIVLLGALYPQLQNAPYFAHVLRVTFQSTSAAFYPYYLWAFVLILAVLAIPIGVSGALLPLLFHELRRERGDLGAIAGRLYSWNTVGSLLGALVGGYLALFWLDLHHVYRAALIALGVGACLLAVRLVRPAGAVASGLAFALLLALAWRAGPWAPERLTAGLFRLRTPNPTSFSGPETLFAGYQTPGRIAFQDDDPISTVTILNMDSGGTVRALLNNGKPDSTVPTEFPTVVGLAVIPCLLAEKCESAFVVGLGTGVTAGELGQLEGIQRVVVSEISPGVREAVSLFSSANHDVIENKKVEIRHGDAYRALSRDDAHYDVIVSEPSNPWVAGVENLYTTEFLSAAKERLNPGGVYAQWFHLYEASDDVIQIILRTFSSVFDDVAVWHTMDSDLILLGWNGHSLGALDVERLEQRAALPTYSAALRRASLETVPALLSHEVLPRGMVRESVEPGPLQSLYKPILNNRAAHDFFIGMTVDIMPSPKLAAAREGVENSLLRRYMQRHGGRLSDQEWTQVIAQECSLRPRACGPLLAFWTTEDSTAPDRREHVEQMIQAGRVDRQMHQRLSLLMSADSGTAPVAFAEAQALTNIFLQFYDPAVPFRRKTLASILSRCQDDGNGKCPALSNIALQWIGRLDIEAEDVAADEEAVPPERNARPIPRIEDGATAPTTSH